MKVTWLGQAGLVFDNGKYRVVCDPYLSDSLGGRDKLPVPEEYRALSADVLIITNTQPDRMDIDTVKAILDASAHPMTLLLSRGAYEAIAPIAEGHNPVLLSKHSVWSEGGITFYSVGAEHIDPTAIGVILDDGDGTYYVSGDTLYNFDVLDDCLDLVEDGVTCAFLPINGRGGNMNAKDAADFAYELGADRAVPVHYGLLDSVDPSDFDFEDALILEPFVEVEL